MQGLEATLVVKAVTQHKHDPTSMADHQDICNLPTDSKL